MHADLEGPASPLAANRFAHNGEAPRPTRSSPSPSPSPSSARQRLKPRMMGFVLTVAVLLILWRPAGALLLSHAFARSLLFATQTSRKFIMNADEPARSYETLACHRTNPLVASRLMAVGGRSRLGAA